MADGNVTKIKPTVSFGFSQKIKTKRLDNTVASENNKDDEESSEFILSVEERQIKSSVPRENKREYVIPTIKQNNWRKTSQQASTGALCRNSENDLETMAATEVMEEASKYNETWEERGKPDSSFSIPLLMQNKIPDGFETDEKLDVSLRPDSPVDAHYNEIPVEQFGLAVLRGMGWKEEMGVGKNSKGRPQMETTLRPKGLGLGADRSQASSEGRHNAEKPEETNDEKDALVMKKGACCVIVDGKYKDLYGIIEGTDEDNARVVVKLKVSGQSVSIMQFCVKVVEVKEYEKYSKYLNKGKTDKYKDEDNTRNGHDQQERSVGDGGKTRHCRDKHNRDANNDKHNRDVNSDNSSRGRKKHKSSSKVSSHSSEFSAHRASTAKMWLCPNLRVRIIDKNFKNGRYYKEKVVVVDMVSADSAVCRTDDGKVLEGLTHSMLETVIPKSDQSHVMVCHGSYKRHLAKLVNRNKDKCLAMVQLLKDRDIVLEIDFDHICEYAGNVDEDFDY